MKRIMFVAVILPLMCTITGSNRIAASPAPAPALVDRIVILVNDARRLCNEMEEMIVLHQVGISETFTSTFGTTVTVSGTASAATKAILESEFKVAADSISAKVLRAKALVP